MSLEAKTREKFAKRLGRFIDKEASRLGCAKEAMKSVAKKVGMSVVNLYRARNGYGPVTIKAHHHAALIMHCVGIVSVAAKIKGRRKSNSQPENFAQA